MGIKNLWTILSPFCDRKPLFELQGKTVAVDLSCWICEAQNIAEYQIQPRMYLRNLYFRTCCLLLMQVSPVFVLEGKAPELKYDTISARNAIQFKGARPKINKEKTNKGRSRFDFILKQCEEMLGYLGIACVKGNGEAESLCAYLNEDGLVDGCISQDSDCFAYGAQIVYRNFSISTQGVQAATGGAVDVYDIRKVNDSLNLGRNKIIAMALLIGCDYSDGVAGIGKESVMKFLETVSDDEVLNKLRSWRDEESIFANYEKQLNDKNICTSCGHSGKIQSHTKNGCRLCSTTKGCDPFKYKEERLRIKNEVNMRNRAIQDPNFPDETLIKEFLDRKDNVSHLDLKWKLPNLVQFVKFTKNFLQWEELYAFEKMLPILTRWQCCNLSLVNNQTNLRGMVHPKRIKKVRNPKGVPCYEIIWDDSSGCFNGLIPQNQLDTVDPEKIWSTIEPQALVEGAYPKLVEEFKQSKIKPKKPSKRKKKAEENDGTSDPSVVKKTRKPKVAKKKAVETNVDDLDSSFKLMALGKTTTTLDSFLKKAVHNRLEQKLTSDVKFSTPVKDGSTRNMSFDLDMSNFGDEDDLELSDIIDDIISKRNVDVLLNLDIDKANSSSFFKLEPLEENDLFEQTFNKIIEIESSGDETEEYELDEADLEKYGDLPKKNVEDSFSDVVALPLHERIKLKYF